MADKQSRLNRWGAKVIPARPKGEIKVCKVSSKFQDNRYLYLMLDDERMICVEVPSWYRDELKCKSQYARICLVDGEWVYHSIIKEE